MNEHQRQQNRSKFTFAFAAFAFGMLISATIMNAAKDHEPEASPSLLFYKGSEFTLSQLPSSIAMPYYEMEQEHFAKQSALLEEATLQLMAADVAKKEGITADEAAQKLLSVTPPTDDEINTFFNKNQDHIKQPLYEIKEDIANYLAQQKARDQRTSLLSELSTKGEFALLIKAPQSPTVEIDTKGYPTIGSDSAKIKIVEFADYQCPHCKDAYLTLHKLLEEHKDHIQLTYMDFPINRSGISRKVAEGGVCADQQSKFWEYHDLAFEGQAALSNESPILLAQQLQLDMSQFETCINNPSTAAKVKTSERQAISLGVRGTPAIYVNGKKLQGHNAAESLGKIIAEELK